MIVGVCDNYGAYEYRVYDEVLMRIRYDLIADEKAESVFNSWVQKGVPVYKNGECVANRKLVVVGVFPLAKKVLVVDTEKNSPYLWDNNAFGKMLQTYQCYNATITQNTIKFKEVQQIAVEPKAFDILSEAYTLANRMTALKAKTPDYFWQKVITILNENDITFESQDFIKKVLLLSKPVQIETINSTLPWVKANGKRVAASLNCRLRTANIDYMVVTSNKGINQNWVWNVPEVNVIDTLYVDVLEIRGDLLTWQCPSHVIAKRLEWSAVERLPNNMLSSSFPFVSSLPSGLAADMTSEGLTGSGTFIKHLVYDYDVLTVSDNIHKCLANLQARFDEYVMPLKILYFGKQVEDIKFWETARFKIQRGGAVIVTSLVAVSTSLITYCLVNDLTFYCMKGSAMYNRLCVYLKEGGEIVLASQEEYTKHKNRLYFYAERFAQEVNMPELVSNPDFVYQDISHYGSSEEREAERLAFVKELGKKLKVGVLMNPNETGTREILQAKEGRDGSKYLQSLLSANVIAPQFGDYMSTRNKTLDRDCNIIADEFIRGYLPELFDYFKTVPLADWKITQIRVALCMYPDFYNKFACVSQRNLRALRNWWVVELNYFLIGFFKLWNWVKSNVSHDSNTYKAFERVFILAEEAAYMLYNTYLFRELRYTYDKGHLYYKQNRRRLEEETDKLFSQYYRGEKLEQFAKKYNALYVDILMQAEESKAVNAETEQGEWLISKLRKFIIRGLRGQYQSRVFSVFTPEIITSKDTSASVTEFVHPKSNQWVDLAYKINYMLVPAKTGDENAAVMLDDEVPRGSVKNLGDALWYSRVVEAANSDAFWARLLFLNYFNTELAKVALEKVQDRGMVSIFSALDSSIFGLKVTDLPEFDEADKTEGLWIFYNTGGKLTKECVDTADITTKRAEPDYPAEYILEVNKKFFQEFGKYAKIKYLYNSL